jgi:hypothetical protein
VGDDGWFNPAINEMFPGEGANDGITERSTRPGFSNCMGVPVSDPEAISDQDFVCSYTDTLRDPFWVNNNQEIDVTHRPLGIKITQTSYSFSQAFAEDFILIDYEFENIASNFLKNVYVGLYVDSDVGPGHQFNHHTDDICGFDKFFIIRNESGDSVDAIPIDVAYIADNDGRPPDAGSGPFDCPNVTGTRVIRAPNPRLRTAFNWWISNGDDNLDFGPAWRAYADRDSLGMGWTRIFGTPVGDLHKYQVMSNREFDYDQLDVCNVQAVPCQPIVKPDGTQECMDWCTTDPSPDAQDICNGYDTRYLLSWGPLGVFEYRDAGGNDIYRLNPGEKFRMTIAYVGGENFHDINNPQSGNQVIDRTKFNFSDLRANARWAREVYDNGMFDTPQYDWGNDHDPQTLDTDGSQGDGVLDTGDGWYGEDVGTDGLFAELPPGADSVAVVYFRGTPWETFAGYYKGPDADGTERDGRQIPEGGLHNALHPEWTKEDNIIPDSMVYNPPIVPARLGRWDMGFMSNNGFLDLGDGIPDFTGPPPPPIPALLRTVANTLNAAAHFGGSMRVGNYVGGLGYELQDEKVILRWSKNASEDPGYMDPFSRIQDFEGYRVHVGNTNQENAFSLLAQFDACDFAYFSDNDSLMTNPVKGIEVGTGGSYQCLAPEGFPADSNFGSPTSPFMGHFKAVGLNTGFSAIKDLVHSIPGDSIYQYAIDAHKLAPRYYAVTAFDFGDPKSGLGPLTTRATTNSVLLAPAGTAGLPVRVVPNPYRAYVDYTQRYGGSGGVSWENQNDGTTEFFAQKDRRIEFINLPMKCLIRIYTVAGDLVQILPHNMDGDRGTWTSATSEAWDLNSRNQQQVVSGIYLFSVEDRTEGGSHEIQTGKFVIIR